MQLNEILPVTEQVDGLPSYGQYIPLPTPPKKSKSKSKKPTSPDTDKTQNTLINYLWFTQNADAT